jgi:hypothetical protein
MGTNAVVIRGIGNPALGSLPGGGGLSSTPPGNVSSITVSGYIDPIALEISLQVTFTPPSGGTFTGVHIWLDIPDHGDGSTNVTVGSTPLGNGSTVTGPFNPIDLGVQTNPAQPWDINLAFPSYLGLDPTKNIPCRLYIASISAVVDNTLVQDGLTNATPNAAFTLVSLASGTPTAGTNVTVNCGTINVQVLANDKSTGKLMTPFVALMGSVPSNPPKGWGYRLYITYGNADPTNPANLTPVTDVQTVAGVVPASKTDAVTDVLNSFALQTPTTTTNATIWAIAGLTDASGKFNPNNVVIGITNACPVTFGSNTGTIDASQAIQSSISAQLTAAEGQLGITPNSLSAFFLAENAALANIGLGGILAEYLGSGASLSNLGAPLSASVLISNASITGVLIASETITGTLLATSGIITTSAQIGFEVVGDSNIGSLNVSKLQAGTATFTGTAIFENASGPAVTITSSEVEVTSSEGTLAATSTGVLIGSSGANAALTSTGLTLTSGSNTLTVTATNIEISAGSNSMTASSSEITLGSSSQYIQISSSGITMITGSSLAGVSISTSGAATFEDTLGTSTSINGNSIATGSISAASLAVTPGEITVTVETTQSSLAYNSLQVANVAVINGYGQFIGNGVNCPTSGVGASGFNVYYTSSSYYSGLSYAPYFASGFTIGGTTYHYLNFYGGIFVGYD